MRYCENSFVVRSLVRAATIGLFSVGISLGLPAVAQVQEPAGQGTKTAEPPKTVEPPKTTELAKVPDAMLIESAGGPLQIRAGTNVQWVLLAVPANIANAQALRTALAASQVGNDNPTAANTGNPLGLTKEMFMEPAASAPLRWGREPLLRDWKRLNERGIALAMLNINLEPGYKGLESKELATRLDAALNVLRQQYPTAKIGLAASGSSVGGALMWLAHSAQPIDHMVLIGGQYRDWRKAPTPAQKVPTLIVQSATNTCPSASSIEAGEQSQRLNAQLVLFFDKTWDTSGACLLAGSMGLRGQDSAMADWVTQWFKGQTVAGSYKLDPNIERAFNERLQQLQMPSELGSGVMESTILTPPGKGPFPLMVFHHGDILRGSPLVDRRTRHVDWTIGRVFLSMGYAVAFPQRPGVGGSDGSYARVFYGERTDPTVKGRYHAGHATWATVSAMQDSAIDPKRVIVAGQSAGGFAVMAMASQNYPWMQAGLNFSGGRTGEGVRQVLVRPSSPASAPTVREPEPRPLVTDGSLSTQRNLNTVPPPTTMVEGFRAFGKTARVPVLMLFAENDSRYKADIIRESALAYAQAGGVGELKLYPPQLRDGHALYHYPQTWLSDVQTFLKTRGLPHTVMQTNLIEAARTRAPITDDTPAPAAASAVLGSE